MRRHNIREVSLQSRSKTVVMVHQVPSEMRLCAQEATAIGPAARSWPLLRLKCGHVNSVKQLSWIHRKRSYFMRGVPSRLSLALESSQYSHQLCLTSNRSGKANHESLRFSTSPCPTTNTRIANASTLEIFVARMAHSYKVLRIESLSQKRLHSQT